MHDNKRNVAIIGAGLAGLSAATALREVGIAVTLFERQALAGGRLGNDPQADMGAQYFTARHPAFRQATRQWQDNGWIAEWSPLLYRHDLEQGLRPSPDTIQRLVAVPSMAALAGYLQQGLTLEHSTINALRQTASGDWLLLTDDDAEHGPFSAVILATSAHAAAELLGVAPSLQQDVARVAMHCCWSVTLQFEQLLPTLVDACFIRTGPLDWLARDSSKPQREGRETWVLQSTASWAEQHRHAPEKEVAAVLAQAMAEVMNLQLPQPIVCRATFWPDARPAQELKWGALAAPRNNLYGCGDGGLGGRIENAWLSGRQAARALLDR